LIGMFSPAFFIMLVLIAFVQYKTVRVFFKLEKKLIKTNS